MFRSTRAFMALLFLLVGLSAVSFPGAAFACSCVDFGVKDSAKAYDTVIRGTILSDDSIEGNFTEVVNFNVEATEIYKGDLSPGLIQVSTAGNSAACGWNQAEGEGDLILFIQKTSLGEYTTNLCAGNQPYSEKVANSVMKVTGADAEVAIPATENGSPPLVDEGLDSEDILLVVIMGGGAFFLIFGMIKTWRGRER